MPGGRPTTTKLDIDLFDPFLEAEANSLRWKRTVALARKAEFWSIWGRGRQRKNRQPRTLSVDLDETRQPVGSSSVFPRAHGL